MKKRTTFKALLVAAAVMTTGAVSVIGASAEISRTDPDITAQVVEVGERLSDMELVSVGSDGERSYKSRYGHTVTIWDASDDPDEIMNYVLSDK